jgi:uncharacterized protein YndB with AHSA1/START domain
MNKLEHNLTRTVSIRAARATVFTYFTDSARWADWWGAGSTIDAQPGGKMYIRHPNGIEAGGEVLEVAGPGHIVFTYGYNSGTPIPFGGSKVTVTLREEGDGTLLSLFHEFSDSAQRDHHIQGWRFQLSLFSNAVLNGLHAPNAEALVDAWYAVWVMTDETARAAELARLTSGAIEFRDRYSALHGHDDLMAHISASQRFMPGVVLKRKGPVKHSQGHLLAGWSAAGPDGKEMMSGQNTYRLTADGRIESVVGFAG